MLRNYLKLAFRNLRRRPGYTAINVIGLGVGLASCLLIAFYVYDELHFDGFHAKAASIYRIVEVQQSPEQTEVHAAATAGPVGPALERDMPEVVNAVRLAGSYTIGRRTVAHGETRFYEEDYFFTEPSFFEMFDFELIRGNPNTVLTQPFTAVLTRQAARKYFGDEDPIGRTLTFERIGEMKVTGLMENPPRNSHLQFEMLFSFASMEQTEGWDAWLERWDSGRFTTYIQVPDEAALASLEPKIPAFTRRYRAEEFGVTRTFYLQALPDIHFYSDHIGAEMNAQEGIVNYLYIFSAIALFILFIACINHINLATAQAMKRAREVGVRKALGAHRKQLIGQFLGESGLLTLLAFGAALILVSLALPFFNALTQKGIGLDMLANGLLGTTILLLLAAVAFMTGAYPAFYLARFQSVQVLKGEVKAGTAAVRLRQGLVVTQFTLSIALIIGTLIVVNQLNYLQNKQLGFNEEALITVDINNGDVRANFETVKRAFASAASVRRVSTSSRVPGDWKGIVQVEVAGEDGPDAGAHTMYFIAADEDFLETFEIPLAAGRNFSGALATDSSSVLLNETAARLLGIDAPDGRSIEIPREISGSQSFALDYRPQVIGIVKDFHYKSLHESIAPLVIGYWSNPVEVIDYFTARVQASGLQTTLAHLRQVGELFDPTHPFEYNFLDERLADFYQTERRLSLLISLAAGLAIFIACLGMFGLVAFTAERRVKEIGIRKVLGAGVGHIVMLLSGSFLRLVGLAFLLAVPLAYIGMNRWLEEFAYHVTIGPGLFVLAGFLALAVAFLTVGYQSVRAALADPVESLRYE